MSYPLGRIVNHDARSLAYAWTAPAGTTLVSKRWPRHIPVLSQGQVGSCTGNAMVGALGTTPVFETLPAGTSLDENEALTIYSAAEKIDGGIGYPPEDQGSSGLSVAKAAKTAGLISGYQHLFNVGDVLAHVSNEGPVLIGISWFDSFFNPSPDGEITIAPGATVAGGHEIVIDEIDVNTDPNNVRIWITNSWGYSWGVQGRAWMTANLLAQLLSQQGDATIVVPLSKPAPTPQPIPTPTPPTPTPTPSPTPITDAALWSTVSAWALAHHYNPSCRHVANELVAWATSNGLH